MVARARSLMLGLRPPRRRGVEAGGGVMQLLGLLAIPLVVGALAWLFARDTITLGEFFVQLGLSVALILASWSWVRARSLEDVEHLNGRVVAKEAGSQACCHCHDECLERYFFGLCKRERRRCRHERDWYWRVEVAGAGTLEDSCLRRPTRPSWWASIDEGDPAVIEHRYVNYLKADPDSLLRRRGVDPASAELRERWTIPPFPEVRDGVKVDRVVVVGDVEAPARWQAELDELNADLGPAREVDVTVVLGDADSPALALAVDAAWLSGPKNALIVVLGAPEGRGRVAWARVVSLSPNPALEIQLRERLRGLELDDPSLVPIIREEVEAGFERRPMAELHYLAGAASPRGWWLVGLYALALLSSLGLSYLFHRLDFSRAGLRRAARQHGRKGMWVVLIALLVRFLRRRSRRH